MKRLLVGSAITLFATSVMATFLETETKTVPCQWVVDVPTVRIHGIPRNVYTTTSEPRCVPMQGSDTMTSGKPMSLIPPDGKRLSDITDGCLQAIEAQLKTHGRAGEVSLPLACWQ